MTWTSPTTWHWYKWIPLYYPNDPWDVVTYDVSGKRINPIIPENAIVPWWRQPKDQWPYAAPWEPKILGAFAPMWFKMREDIGAPVKDPPGPWPSPNIWPTVTFPKPAGLTHVDTRPDGIWGKTKSVPTIKIHMQPVSWLEVTPHPSVWAQGKFEEAMRVMSRRRPIRVMTEDGSSITLKSIKSAAWNQHRDEYKERQKEIKAKRQERYNEMLAAKAAKYAETGVPEPAKDLF
jgi:hypothetical protein